MLEDIGPDNTVGANEDDDIKVYEQDDAMLNLDLSHEVNEPYSPVEPGF